MDNTTLFLRFEGTDESTTITEETGRTITNTNVELDTAQYTRGDSSGLFNGTSSLLSITNGDLGLNLGSNPFTIEFWVRFNSIGTTQAIVDFRTTATEVAPYVLYNTSTGKLEYNVNGSVVLSSDTSLLINTWYHIEIAKYHNVTRLFINGDEEDDYYVDDNTYLTVSSIKVGADYTESGNFLNGWINDLRISDIARHRSPFDSDSLIMRYNRTTASTYNKRDIDRVNASIAYLISFINDNLGGSLVNINTISAIDKKTYLKSSLINDLEENINNIKDFLASEPSGWQTLSENWLANSYAFTYDNADDLEKDLYLIETVIDKIKLYGDTIRMGDSFFNCGKTTPQLFGV